MTGKLLLNVDEAAHVLGCRRTYLYGMIQRGELPVVKLGRLTRVPAAALEEYVRERWEQPLSAGLRPPREL
ncbi:MAG: helix-turn-helix domain-containing protein [Candidatus Dormibacteraeota bacterium]|jgi:excisionase family DNA binding protein|nr:helix-turn-helix domain-containing protein [Candidatus Dormibacteraeota bacterium]